MSEGIKQSNYREAPYGRTVAKSQRDVREHKKVRTFLWTVAFALAMTLAFSLVGCSKAEETKKDDGLLSIFGIEAGTDEDKGSEQGATDEGQTGQQPADDTANTDQGQAIAPVIEPPAQPNPPAANPVTVYITNSGEKYHRESCSSLSKSKIPISLEDAVAQGYGACGRCNPPTL
jgi:hypothetical protein